MFALPISVLLVITVVTSWGKSVLGGYYAKRVPDAARFTWLFGLIQSVVCGGAIALVLGLSGGLGTFSIMSVILGLIMGLANIFGLVTNLFAMACGPFTYTTVIISMSTVITALSGPFFGEGWPSAFQWIGIALMVVCLILAPERKKDETKRVTLKWLILCGLSLICSGVTGIVQKTHQAPDSLVASEMAALLITAFSVSAVFSAVMMAVRAVREGRESHTHAGKVPASVFTTSIVSGAIFAFPHTVNLFLAGKLPAVIMFPLVNLCPMIVAMVTGILLFRERLSPARWAGVAIGLVSIVLVSGVLG